MSLITIVLILLVAAALWTAATYLLLRAALGLALTSALLAVAMYMMGATLAAVIELSVCAGLISVVFVSVISLTQRRPFSEYYARRKKRFLRFWPLPLILFIVGVGLSLVNVAVPSAVPPAVVEKDAAAVLWSSRGLDLFGQVLILLAGVFGVLVLFKRSSENDD
jgi:NADH-quinone oxidoreductase subunit J